MNSLPVSIPIISYNQADFIQETVVSAVEQDYDNLQVVVCDDASTDSTQEILLDIVSMYPERVELHLNEANLGGGRNRIQSLLLSRGELITYLDGDDIFLPGKIQKQVDFMQDRADCTLSYHNVEVFDSKTDETIYYWKDRFGSGDGDIKKLVRYGNNLCTLSIMFRRECMPKLEYYKDVRIGQDWIIIFNILKNNGGKYAYIDDVLARHRRHSSNLTLNWDVKLDSQLNTLNLIEDKFPQFATEIRLRRSEIFLIQSLLHTFRKNFALAGRSFFKSLVFMFPFLWNLFRIPLRELIYWIIRGRKTDSLLRSLLNK